MSEKNFLDERRQALEEEFFSKHNADMLQSLRETRRREQAVEALRDATRIQDDTVLLRLVGLGFDAASLLAFALVPLVMVAWADGAIDGAEREKILRDLELLGAAPGSATFRLVEGWLARRPDPALFDAWEAYTRALVAGVPPADREWLRSALMVRAEEIARSTGGLMGMLFSISRTETSVLDRIRRAFG